MITVKDIARRANVSQGTVSNVLNNRGNVSAEKIQRVMAAAKELGYVANAQAKQLRKEIPLSSHIAVILPNINEDRYVSFFNGIQIVLEEQGYTPLLFVSGDSPYKEEQIAKHVAEMRVSGIITITSSISHTDIYQDAKVSGAKIVYALRETKHAHRFVGFDFSLIGEEIATYVLSQSFHRVAVISDPEYYPENRDLIGGLRRGLLGAEFPCLLEIKTADWLNISVSPFDLFEGRQQTPDVIILTNSFFLPKVQLAFSVAADAPCPPIITLSLDKISKERSGVVYYALNYMNAGSQTAQKLLSCLDNKGSEKAEASFRKILIPCGFPPKVSQVNYSPTHLVLRILISKCNSSTALQRIIPQFTKKTGIEVKLEELLPSDLFPGILQKFRHGEADLVRSNMSLLPLFPGDMFYTFGEEEFQQLTAGMLPRIVRDFSRVRGQLQCVPFDIGIDMLVYRKDLFENQLLQRMYYEQTGETLEVPKTFDQYARIVRYFDRRYNSNSPVQAGTGINWDSPTELSSTFFLRYINYMQNRVITRGETLVESNAVLQALSNMYSCGQNALPVREKRWIGATLDDFINGQTAMELVFLNYSSNILHLQKNIYGGQIGYTTIPGGTSYITGGSLAILANSPHIEAAKAFIQWVSSYPQAELITLYGGLSPYGEVYQNSEILLQYPWYSHLLEDLDSAYGRELWEVFDAYHSSLDLLPLLQGIVQGQQRPEDVLPKALQVLRSSLLPKNDIQ